MRRPQLFMLHFAGGNCYSYAFLRPLLGRFEVYTPELPGRGRRWAEQLLTDFSQAAVDVFRQIRGALSGEDYLIYGHSLGSFLALQAATMLEKEGVPPAHVIVSGNAGPGSMTESERRRHLLDRVQFRQMLDEMAGGGAGEMNDELFELFEPILRADFCLAETQNITKGMVIGAPLTAMMGSKERAADSIANWAKFTSGRFDSLILDGGHFFINEHAEKIAAVIDGCYKSITSYTY